MQVTDPKELTSKLQLDKIEKQTQSSKPSKGKQEEDYSKYIK